MDVLEPLRKRLRVTFSGQSEVVPAWEEALEEGEDAGYFAPDSAVWAVHGGMTPIAAGIRALLTQALHPGALAGVAEHSDYRQDPLARLAGTIRWIFTLTYGDTTAARAACDYVRRRHLPVTGSYTDGRGEPRDYSANDPELAEWVHIAFTDAFLRSYEIFRGPVPAERGGADAYVRDWAVAAELMGVPDPPRSDAALRARIDQYDAEGRLAGGARVAEVVSFLKDPPLDPLLLPGYRLLFAAVVDSLPPRYRELLGLTASGPVLPGGRRLLLPTRLGGKLALGVVGTALQKQGPSELAARRRLARLGHPADFTYAGRWLTRDKAAPPGHAVTSRRVAVGEGRAAFERLAAGIMGWDLHRGAGLKVPAGTRPAQAGDRVAPAAGIGAVRLKAPCRVVWTVQEEDRVGFGYGTLSGHPVAGEESFLAVLDPDGQVWFELYAFSRPAGAFRWAGPLASAGQWLATWRYQRSAARLAAGSAGLAIRRRSP